MALTAYRLGLRGQFRETQLECFMIARGIHVQRVFAPDLSRISNERLRLLYSDRVSRAIAGRTLTSGEVSATLGHRRMLRHFLAGSSDWGLFFEDDAEPLEGLDAFAHSLPGAAAHPLFIDLFPTRINSTPSDLMWTGVQVRERLFPDVVSCGYAMNRSGAIALLRASRHRRVVTPADWEPWWLGQCRFLEVAEPLVFHPPQGVNSILARERAPATTRPATRGIRSLPFGMGIERVMRQSGFFALARSARGAPFRMVYLRDRGRI